MTECMAQGPARPAQPGLWAIIAACTKLSITSFGGGISGVMHSEFVVRRAWLTEEEFLTGLAISQALPGVNVTNLAIWLGYRCRGTAGAAVALAAVIVPPAIVIVLAGALLLRLTDLPVSGALLSGVAAAAMGLSLAVGYRAARRACVNGVSGALFIVTMIGSGLLHLSVVVLIAVLAPIGIGFALRRQTRDQG